MKVKVQSALFQHIWCWGQWNQEEWGQFCIQYSSSMRSVRLHFKYRHVEFPFWLCTADIEFYHPNYYSYYVSYEIYTRFTLCCGLLSVATWRCTHTLLNYFTDTEKAYDRPSSKRRIWIALSQNFIRTDARKNKAQTTCVCCGIWWLWEFNDFLISDSS